MAAYYHTHHHSHGTSNTDIQDHNSNSFHTLILMNPNLTDHHHQQQQQQPSHNILLLNSAATVAAGLSPSQPLLPQHHFVRLPTSPPQPNNVTLYGYPSHEARDTPRARQGLSLSLSSQNPALGGGLQQGGEGDVAGGQGLILGSKYLKAAQELLEEVVHVDDEGIGGVNFKSSSANDTDGSPKKGNDKGECPSEDRQKYGGSSGGGQLSTAERQEIQMKKAKLVTMLAEAEQRYRQYNHQMQIVMESFEQAAGMGSAKIYTALALKTISKQFRCLKDAIQGQIRAANKILGDDHEGGSGSSGKIEGSRLKYIDHQIRQQRALQQLGMIQNPNAWRPQRGLPERSVSVLRAWLFEHFLHPYPKDSDKIMLAKQTGLTRSQVSNWFINARVRLWKPMIEEMYTEELKEQEHNNGLSEEKLRSSSKENSNTEDNANQEHKINIAENQVKSSKDQNNATAAASAAGVVTPSFIGIPTNSATPFKGSNTLTQNQHGFTLTSPLEMEGGIPQRSPKRHRNEQVLCYDESTNGEIMIKFGNEKLERQNGNGYPIVSRGMNFMEGVGGGEDEKLERENVNGYPIISGGMNFVGMGGGDLGVYPMGEIGRFEAEDFPQPQRFLQGNGISLSLGLPPSCENHQQQLENLSATNHTFLSPNQNIQFRRANDFGTMSSPTSHSSAAAFDCIDIQNRKGFAAQLLPDFVA